MLKSFKIEVSMANKIVIGLRNKRKNSPRVRDLKRELEAQRTYNYQLGKVYSSIPKQFHIVMRQIWIGPKWVKSILIPSKFQ